MKTKYSIRVTGTEHRQNEEITIEFDNEFYGRFYDDLAEAEMDAESIDLNEYLSDFLIDFSGNSGAISIEILTWEVDEDGGKTLETCEEIDGILIEFRDSKPFVDGKPW